MAKINGNDELLAEPLPHIAVLLEVEPEDCEERIYVDRQATRELYGFAVHKV